jgi:predicted GNAT superfamily acetyltransferase
MAAAPHDTSTTSAVALDVRPVASLAEYAACVAVQREVWGAEFESVPASMLQVATYVGGLCIGAFTSDGELAGFVFGLGGTIDGRPTHWSHLLGVRESARNLGVGRLLKERQREILASRGIAEMCWTFDPMIAKNAHLNLNLLGASLVRYVPDMYGTTGSPLHHGLATDRLLVSCRTTPHTPRREASRGTDAPMLTPAPQAGDEVVDTNRDRPDALRIEVPADFRLLLSRSPALATAWHAALRRHFTWALASGYTVTGLQRDAVASRCFYTLEKQ